MTTGAPTPNMPKSPLLPVMSFYAAEEQQPTNNSAILYSRVL